MTELVDSSPSIFSHLRERQLYLATFWRWLSFAVAITILCGTLYAGLQQNLRQNANDPQIAMAENALTNINNGAKPENLNLEKSSVDIGGSLSPFMIVYDTSGNPLASSGTLNSTVPRLPLGAVTGAINSEERFTWQPQEGTRLAVVVTGNNQYVVLAGRSLREVEIREDDALGLVAAGWIVALAGTFLAILVERIARRRMLF